MVNRDLNLSIKRVALKRVADPIKIYDDRDKYGSLSPHFRPENGNGGRSDPVRAKPAAVNSWRFGATF
jgi:hypothetical protein